MPRTKQLTAAQKENCSYVVAYLLPRLTNLDAPAGDQVYEVDDGGKHWRIRSHWFDPESTDPTRPPLLEVVVTCVLPERGKSVHYWFYRPGTGNDCHPEYAATWRVHAWVG
jgi:hypothetical protein